MEAWPRAATHCPPSFIAGGDNDNKDFFLKCDGGVRICVS